MISSDYPAMKAKMQDIANGIASVDSVHLMTIENQCPYCASQDDWAGGPEHKLLISRCVGAWRVRPTQITCAATTCRRLWARTLRKEKALLRPMSERERKHIRRCWAGRLWVRCLAIV